MTQGGSGSGGTEANTRRQPGSHRKTSGAGPAPKRAFRSGFTTLRDLASFILGAGIVIHEVVSPSVELFTMGTGLSLMGLPFALAADEKRKGG